METTKGLRTAANLILRAGAPTLGALLLVGAFLADVALHGSPGFGLGQWILVAVGCCLLAVGFSSAEWRGRITLLSVSMVASIVLCEVVLRLVAGARLGSIYVYDRDLLFALPAGTREYYSNLPENGGNEVLVSINSQGYRGPESSETTGSRRIIVFGDSYVLASATADERTFATQLQAKMGVAGLEDLHVINAGVSGYGLDQTYLRMQRELGRQRAEMIVLVVYAGNDFGDPVRNKLFRLDSFGALALNSDIDTDSIREHLEVAGRTPYVIRAWDLAWQGLLAQWRKGMPRGSPYRATEAFLEAARSDYRNYVVRLDNRVGAEVLEDYYDADVAMTPDSESAKYKIRVMYDILSAIRALATSRHLPLAMLIVPHPIDAIVGYEWGQVDVKKYPSYVRAGPSKIVRDIADSLGIPNVDLMESFGGDSPARYYLRGGDPHWNDAGQRFAAEQMADLIVAKRLID